jgi:hypothetical protein
MTVVLNVFLNVLLLAALVGFVFAIAWMAFWSTDVPFERAMRAFAFFAGALVVLGAQASGVGFAQYAVKSLAGVRPAGGGVKFLVTIIPGGAGVAMGWYITRAWKKHEVIAFRFLAFVGMLAATAFAVIYAQAFHVKGVRLGAAILPNVAFVVGLILYMMIKFVPGSASSETRSGPLQRIRTLSDAMAERREKQIS